MPGKGETGETAQLRIGERVVLFGRDWQVVELNVRWDPMGRTVVEVMKLRHEE